jgi:hypothetical protein
MRTAKKIASGNPPFLLERVLQAVEVSQESNKREKEIDPSTDRASFGFLPIAKSLRFPHR